ncbi:MAG TPA: hypothetical protein VGJ20_12505 [Xanthobacteraceae bacterium]|jgi:hypothetical protein
MGTGRFDLVGRLRKSLLHAPRALRAGQASSSKELCELTERLREPVDLDAVELAPAQRRSAPAALAVADTAAAKKSGPGRPKVFDWKNIIWPTDADNCREFLDEHERKPSLKERHEALIKALVPHYDTFRKELANKNAEEIPQNAEDPPKVD